MKKNFLKSIFFLAFCLAILSPVFVLADNDNEDPIIQTGDDVIEIIEGFAVFLWRIFVAVTVIFFIIAGITFMTAAGDLNKIERAKTMFFYGVIGVAIAVLAGGMYALIENLLKEAPDAVTFLIGLFS